MKVLTESDVRQLLQLALDAHTLELDVHHRMLEDLVGVVADYHGGQTVPGLSEEKFEMGLEITPEVPDDGGLYAHVCTDVLWQAGREWVPVEVEHLVDISDQLYILNHTDRPCPQHVVYRRKNGVWAYVDEDPTARKYEVGPVLHPEATSLQTFGLQALLCGRQVEASRVRSSSATYADGRPRRWQDVADFTIVLPKDSELC